MYYKGSKAAIVVYDITSYVFNLNNPKETFRRAKDWIRELNENASANIVIALVGNKLDLEESRQVQKSVE